MLPSAKALREAFEALESGADAVLSPAADGGISLLGLPERDAELLARLAPRERRVAESLRARLERRGRRVALVASASDIDGPRSLASMLSSIPAGALRSLARVALRAERRPPPDSRCPRCAEPHGIPSLRAPPSAANKTHPRKPH